MSLKIEKYNQYFFDCDGVILNSNHIKSDVFYNVAKYFSIDLASDFLSYHKANGGVSRFKKFEYFFSSMMEMKEYSKELALALDMFQIECVKNLKICNLIPGIEHFLKLLPQDSKKYVVSGGFQDEVRMVLKAKNLDQYFEGIYGSPTTKFEIMETLRSDSKAIFFGDAKLDFEVAQKYHCDFMFISDHSEFKDYENFFIDKKLVIIPDFTVLI